MKERANAGRRELVEEAFESQLAAHCVAPRKDPDSGHLIRCGSRIGAVCPSCSALYRGDWARIVRSGMVDEEGRLVRGYRFLLVTLTAPSFGRVHSRIIGEEGLPKVCAPGACHRRHGKHDPQVGAPLDSVAYDFAGQMTFNQAMPRLFVNTVARWRRSLGVRLDFVAVTEPQLRCVTHLHALVRVPAGTECEDELIKSAREATRTTWDNATVRWGEQIDVQLIAAAEGTQSAVSTVRYLLKATAYTLKSIDTYTRRQSDMARQIGGFARYEFVCGPECGAWVCECCKVGEISQCEGQCSGPISPSRCKEVIHKRVSGSQKPITYSRGSKADGLPGWSLTGLTRTKLQQQRRDFRAASSDDANETDVSRNVEAALRRAERLRRQMESRKRIPSTETKSGRRVFRGA